MGEILIRNVDYKKDRQFILNCHCCINYYCDSDWVVARGYETYSDKWFSTNQPNEFWQAFLKSSEDNLNISIVVEDSNEKVGYAWVRFYDISEYNILIAEIEDIFVANNYRKKGIGTEILKYIEKICKESGVTVLRAGTGINNILLLCCMKSSDLENIEWKWKNCYKYKKMCEVAYGILGYL